MSKKTPNLTVPERRLRMADGSMALFRGDHRAWYTLERHTGQPLMDFIAAVGAGGSVPMATLYDLAWSLNATERMREQRGETFDGFLERIPPVGQLAGFVQPLMDLLTEAFQAEGQAGNPPAPPEAART